MKASQSSLYRELENLMLWFIPIGNNIPNDFALRKLGERMQNEMLDAQELEHWVCSCNSYMGFLVYHNSYALRRRMFGRMKWFWKCAYITDSFKRVVQRSKYKVTTVLTKRNTYYF